MKTELKSTFLATVSVAILVAFSPMARASDLPAPAAEPVAYVASPLWSVYAEAGAFFTNGDRMYQGFPLNDVVSPFPGIGPEGAVGVDYRLPDSMWHLSADLRYGWASRSKSHGQFNNVPVPINFTATNFPSGIDATNIRAGTAKVRESHLVADFMVGRDLGIGVDTQIKLGVRIADLRSRTTGPGIAFQNTNLTSITSVDTTELRSRFFGIGPRIALTGNVPISGAWSVDYGVGAAYLFSVDRSAKFLTTFGGGMVERSDKQGVVNVDGSLAVAYNFSPNLKLSVGYRADAYFNALPGLNFSKVAGDSDSTRIYHGAFVRLTGKF